MEQKLEVVESVTGNKKHLMIDGVVACNHIRYKDRSQLMVLKNASIDFVTCKHCRDIIELHTKNID